MTFEVQHTQPMSAAIWMRTTLWRQGSVVPSEAAIALELVKPEEVTKTIAVIVSHDCDIACDDLDAEPDVELIIGCPIEVVDGNCTAAKNPRRLHLQIPQAQTKICLELNATRKITVPKQKLAAFQPAPEFALRHHNLVVLQIWLASRYKRPAFPEELVRRLKPVESALLKEAKKTTTEILGIFIGYDPEEYEPGEQEPYSLSLTVVYSTNVEGAEDRAKAMVQQLRATFDKHFKNNDHWHFIELQNCVARSDTEFTLRALLNTKQYRLEYLSYRQDPPGEVAEVV